MKKPMRTIVMFTIAVSFLMPCLIAAANDYENNDRQNEAETLLPYLGKSLAVNVKDQMSVQLVRADSQYKWGKYLFFPGTGPFLSAIGARTRNDRDIWLKDVERTINPGTPNTHGTKDRTSTFTVSFQNNGSGGDVRIRFKAVQHPLEEGDTLDNMPIEWKEEKNVASVGGGSEGTVTFEWTPQAASLYVLNFTAYERGDPDDGNNHLYWPGWVNQIGDTCDNEVASDFENPSPVFHVTDGFNDPEPDHHSGQKVWAHFNEATHFYTSGNHTIDTPWIDLNDFNRQYSIWYSNLFSGSLGANDHHKMLLAYDNNQDWILKGDVDAAANPQISQDWFHFTSGEDYPGMFINYMDVRTNVMFRLCVGENGGAVKGYMFDDLEVFGIQNFTDRDGDGLAGVPDFPEALYTELKIENADTANIKDSNNNDVIDLEGEPGGNICFNFILTNIGTAPISEITFEVDELPEKWDNVDVEFTPSSITTTLDPRTTKEVEVRVNIPEGSRASADFGENKEFNPYIIEFSATAMGSGDPVPDPAKDIENLKIESLVTERPAIEVIAANDNLTAVQGATSEYSITIENTGNCNLTGNMNTEIVLEVRDDPPGLWSVNLHKEKLEIEYGESEEASISVTNPINEKAGYYRSEITISIEEFDIEEVITLITGVDQVYGLELDFKDRNDNAHEVDPAQSHQLFKPITFEINNLGNGEDVARFEVTAKEEEDEDWFDMEGNSITLEPVGGLHAEEDFVIEFTIPEDAVEGDHVFTVKAVSENDETGDTETGEREITFTILRPDLTVSTIFDLEPEEPVLGEETLISTRIFNNGTTTATSFSVYLYITEDGGEEELVGYQIVNILQKGQLMDLPSFEYVFDEFKEHTIRVEVDPKGVLENGNVTEMDETNNEARKTIMVIAPELEFKKEELVVEAGLDTLILNDEGNFILEKISEETEYSITITVKNDGDSDASKVQVNLKVMYLDGDRNEWKETEDNYTIESIKPGKTGTATFTWIPLLWNTQYSIELTVDPEDKIPESGEKNNDWAPPELFVTPKKSRENGRIIPGFVLVFLLGAVVITGMLIYYRKRGGSRERT